MSDYHVKLIIRAGQERYTANKRRPSSQGGIIKEKLLVGGDWKGKGRGERKRRERRGGERKRREGVERGKVGEGGEGARAEKEGGEMGRVWG